MLRRRRPPSAVGAPAATPPPPTAAAIGTGVALLGDLAPLGPGLVLKSGGRFHPAPLTGDARIAVTAPLDPAAIVRLRAWCPAEFVVVVDRRAACRPADIAAALDGGADAFVPDGNLDLLVAQLDALTRRSAAGPSHGQASEGAETG
jgi:hypothetical protein